MKLLNQYSLKEYWQEHTVDTKTLNPCFLPASYMALYNYISKKFELFVIISNRIDGFPEFKLGKSTLNQSILPFPWCCLHSAKVPFHTQSVN